MWFVADFETTTEAICADSSTVWLYAICNENAEIVNYGKSIDEFFNYISKLNDCTIYFHNLAFDGVYILNYLFTHDFTHFKGKLRKKDNKGFSELIGSMGQFYQITINFSRERQIKIQDSLKIINSKVEKIAKDFGIDEQKLTIDYNDITINNDKLEYVFHDVIIIAKALKIVKELGADRMTIGSSSYNNILKYNPKIKELCPELDDNFLIIWRKAFRGGRSQVNEKYKGKILHGVYRHDINSMYAYIQYCKPLPIGKPIKITKRNSFKFELYHIKATFSLKENHIPSLLKNGGIFSDSKYYINSELDEELYITSIDYKLLEKNYHIFNAEFIEMYGFYTSTNLFKKYIEYYYTIKNESVGAKRAFAKSMLVNAYGKFGSKLIDKAKYAVLENGVIKYVMGEDEKRKKYYLPIALAICSYAHELIDDAIDIIGYDNFVYCDTDSVHSLTKLPDDMIHDKYLGKFKLEAIEETCKYVRQKTYVTFENNEWYITCSGLPNNTKQGIIDYYKDDVINIFDKGLTILPNNEQNIPPKLRHTNVKGGVLLKPTPFRIR